MRAAQAHLLEADPLSRLFDRIIGCLMAALLAFMPLAFGAAEAWAEEVVVAISGTLIFCFLLKVLIRADAPFVRTWAYAPLGLFVLLVVVQLIPLPSSVLGAISPNTLALKTDLAGGLSRSAREAGGMTISFYPLATQRALRLALAVSAVFVVTVNVYRRPDQIERLLWVAVAVAGGVALLALAQIVTGSQKIYWRIDAAAPAGPYVNRNNYCQFMNLSVGAALGLLLLRLKNGLGRMPVVFSHVVERLCARELRAVWYLSGMIVLAVASIFLSLSRGGMLSLLIAWAVTIAVLGLKKRLNAWGWVMCALAVCAFACVLYIGFETVYDRLANLREYGGRWQLLVDSARVWTTFPLLGAGLGVHEYIFPMFDRSTILALADYVENEYVQTAEETGIVGFALVAAFGAVIFRNYLRCIRDGRSGVGIAAIGLGAGLLAVLIHSVCDFGLHLPSIACLAAVFCGLVVTMARGGGSSDARPPGRKSARARLFAALCLAGVAATWLWAVTGADAARRAEGYWKQAQRLETRMRENNWAVANADYTRLISLTGKALQLQPDNVLYRHWLNVHRWRAVSRVTEPETGNTILGPAAPASAEKIVSDLQQAHADCPTFGPSYSLAGQLRRFVLGDEGGAELIRTGRALAPCDPAACVAVGTLEAHEGNVEASLEAFRRALRLDGRWFDRIVKVYVFQVRRPDLALEIAGDDFGRLLAVAEILDQEGNAALAAKARQQARVLLLARCEAPDAPARTLAKAAEICLRDKQYERAADYYRRALSRECGNVAWRLNFATVLEAIGRAPEAREQARICLKLMPGMPGAKRLIAKLSTRRIGDLEAN